MDESTLLKVHAWLYGRDDVSSKLYDDFVDRFGIDKKSNKTNEVKK